MKRWILALPLMALACAPLTAQSYLPTPEFDLSAVLLRPAVVDASASTWPAWANDGQRAGADRIAFVGVSTAPTFDAAKSGATRDLLSAISSFVSVDVDASMIDHATNDSLSVVEVVNVKSSSSLSGVRADRFYWEQKAAPLAPKNTQYRYFVRAWVPRSAIARARITRQATRAAQTGRRSVAIVPFTGQPGSDAALGPGLVARLHERLSTDRSLYVIDPSVVRAMLPEGQSDEWKIVERLQDNLLPDLIVSGSYQQHGDRLRVTIVVYDGSTGRARKTSHATRPYREVLQIDGALADAILDTTNVRTSTAVEPSQQVEANYAVAAFEESNKAGALFAAGDNQEALAAIRRSVALRPDNSRAFVRMGRILERIGHYGRIPPRDITARQRAERILCTEAGRAAAEKSRLLLEERSRRLQSGQGATEAAPWWTDQTPMVDTVLNQVVGLPLPLTDASPEPIGYQGLCAKGQICEPTSAAEAYAHALLLARGARDIEGQLDSAIVLADLAVRVDRLNHAQRLYERVLGYGLRHGDLHRSSLADVGLASIAQKRGNLAGADSFLKSALNLRQVLGEKPYLLEIYNALGAVSVAQGRHAQARDYYRSAQRLANDLGNRYLAAALANNIGVLEYLEGAVDDASEHFQSAFEFLSDLDEAEGRIASGVNLAFVNTIRGEPDSATALLDQIDALVAQTTQQARLARLSAHRGSLGLAQGRTADALVSLNMSWSLYRGLNRTAQMRRQQSNLLATELLTARADPAALQCIVRGYWQLGTPVFKAPDGQNWRVQTLESIVPGFVKPDVLVRSLNAATVAVLSDWRPAQVRYSTTTRRRRRSSTTKPIADSFDDVDTLEEAPIDDAPPVPVSEAPEVKSQSESKVIQTVPGSVIGSKKAADRPTQAYQAQADFDRILETFSINPDVLIFLDPALCDEALDSGSIAAADRMLDAVLRHAEQLGTKRVYAAALLNQAAVRWFDHRPDEAYTLIMLAQSTFAALGDVQGLAHAHEWVAYMLQQSGAVPRANENFAVAEQLFSAAGNQAGAARVRALGQKG